MTEYTALKNQKKMLDDEIEKLRMKEGKELIKRIVKEYKLPASYLAQLAQRVQNNPNIYSKSGD